MKKLLALLLSLCTLLTVTGCVPDAETLEIIGDVVEIAGDIASEINSGDADEGAEEELSSKDSDISRTSDKNSENSGETSEYTENEKEVLTKDDVSESPPGNQDSVQNSADPSDEKDKKLPEDGQYTSVNDVALYIHLYRKLPKNFITKSEARELGWSGGGLDEYAPGKSIGGDSFGNYEGLLPERKGRKYTECDIDTAGKNERGAKRIVFSNDGLIYYTADHYESFTQLYNKNGEV